MSPSNVVPARPRSAAPRRVMASAKRHGLGLLALAVLIGALCALLWTSQAHPGADMQSYPYANGGPGEDGLKQRLMASALVILAVGGLFGVVAWLADLQSAQMSLRGRRRFKQRFDQPTDDGVG